MQQHLDGVRAALRHNFGYAWAVGIVMAVVTAVFAAVAELPILDPDAVVAGVPAYVRMPAIILAAIAVDIVPRVVWRARRDGGGFAARWREVVHERWPRQQWVFAVGGVAAWYLTYATFRNLKSMVPFVNGKTWDVELRHLDQVLWFGHDPAVVMHDLFGTSWAAYLFAGVYFVWIVLVPASIAFALVFARNHAVSSWYVTAVAFDWALGAALYFAVPSLGPVFTEAQRGQFADLPYTYNTSLVDTLWSDRTAVLNDVFGAHTLQTIAAFPSLHVGIMVTICLVVQYGGFARWMRVTAWVFLGLTILATIYLGWHYFVDVIAGAGVGSLTVWLAALATGNRVGLRPVLRSSQEPVTVADASSSSAR
ncbi:phosphatase PAP2 family protein [Nocardioides marinquilinus]